MGANPIDYPDAWRRTEFTCNCGTKCRVDVELSQWAEILQPISEHFMSEFSSQSLAEQNYRRALSEMKNERSLSVIAIIR